MSLVIAAISYFSRSRLHNASISEVLPEPTGPPMPTRSGPLVLLMIASTPEKACVLAFVAHAGEVGTKGCAAEIVKRRRQSAVAGFLDGLLQSGKQTLTVCLPERDEPHAGGNEIGRDGMQISMQ